MLASWCQERIPIVTGNGILEPGGPARVNSMVAGIEQWGALASR